jgi:hypothetical protein
MARSEKPDVIDRIYDTLLDPATGTLSRRIVTNEDIQQAIEWCRANLGSKLSPRNPANFMKDIVRGKGASSMWPERLKALRITGRQVTGDGKVFEFVDYAPGQIDPFPSAFEYDATVWRHDLQSVSMPLATKELGRDDETYLIQVAVKLAVVETHFALRSPINVIEISHLQVGIKLRLTEVDSLYSGVYEDDGGRRHALVITTEAKKRGQRILEGQVVRQVQAAFDETPVDLVVPTAMAVVDLDTGESGIYFVEFERVRRGEQIGLESLTVCERAVYVLRPAVKGI